MRSNILFLLGLGAVAAVPHASWPYAPFLTSGRWIVNQRGDNVTYAGVNWPGGKSTSSEK